MLERYKNQDYYLSGDFTVYLFHCNESREGFTTAMQSFGLFPLMNRATRMGETRASLLDWTNSIENYDRSGVVTTGAHLTFALFGEGQAANEKRSFSCFNFNA